MFSYFEPNFIENSFEKVVFQILAKIEMLRNKNWLFGRHFEMVQHITIIIIVCFFFGRIIFIVHTYMVQISLPKTLFFFS